MWCHRFWVRRYLSASAIQPTSYTNLETDNVINEKNGGYDNVKEFIPIAQPGSGTLAKLDTLRPSTVTGDRTVK